MWKTKSRYGISEECGMEEQNRVWEYLIHLWRESGDKREGLSDSGFGELNRVLNGGEGGVGECGHTGESGGCDRKY